LVTKIEEVPEEEANELYVLEEPETGKVIECYLDSFAIINDVRYAIAFPKDWAVSIATENEDGILDPIDPSDEIMDDMFPWLADYLAKDDIEIMHTPVTLTLMGEFMEDDEDDDEDDDEEWEDEEEEEIDWVKEDGEAAELREVTPEELEALNLKMAEQGGGRTWWPAPTAWWAKGPPPRTTWRRWRTRWTSSRPSGTRRRSTAC